MCLSDYIIKCIYLLLTKTTDAQNEVAHSYHKVREFYFLAVVFAATLVNIIELIWSRSVRLNFYIRFSQYVMIFKRLARYYRDTAR